LARKHPKATSKFRLGKPTHGPLRHPLVQMPCRPDQKEATSLCSRQEGVSIYYPGFGSTSAGSTCRQKMKSEQLSCNHCTSSSMQALHKCYYGSPMHLLPSKHYQISATMETHRICYHNTLSNKCYHMRTIKCYHTSYTGTNMLKTWHSVSAS